MREGRDYGKIPGKIMNILFVWTGVTSYMADCWRELSCLEGVSLQVVVEQVASGRAFDAAKVLSGFDCCVVELGLADRVALAGLLVLAIAFPGGAAALDVSHFLFVLFWECSARSISNIASENQATADGNGDAEIVLGGYGHRPRAFSSLGF